MVAAFAVHDLASVAFTHSAGHGFSGMRMSGAFGGILALHLEARSLDFRRSGGSMSGGLFDPAFCSDI